MISKLSVDFTDPVKFVIEDLFSKEECENMIKLGKKNGFIPVAKTGGGAAGKKNRNNSSAVFTDETIANMIWNKVQPYMEADLTNISNFYNNSYVGTDPTAWKVDSICDKIRIYMYDKGEYFNPHMDGSLKREVNKDGNTYVQQTFVSLMVYLNDDFKGGETEFFENSSKMANLKHKFTIVPKRGMVAIFPHENLHRSTPIVKGIKYLLRTDVVYSKKKPIHEKLLKFHKTTEQPVKEQIGEWIHYFHPSCKNYQTE
eukprot:TRINITY_DN8864_c0_g1_i2.p1 TRINITY_DN8864_c0_g1~~TRINITY_DN8864_c0_g1_i2.p1  ORF type:complete len:257 (+),score=36.17 TRINITY_DN8864_c0_g1_i2:46-816(+)